MGLSSIGLGKALVAVVGITAVGAAGYTMLSGECLIGTCSSLISGNDGTAGTDATVVAASAATDTADAKGGCCMLSAPEGEGQLVLASSTTEASAEGCSLMADAATESTCSMDAAPACSTELVAAASSCSSEAATACSSEATLVAVSAEADCSGEEACNEGQVCSKATECCNAPAIAADEAVEIIAVDSEG